MTIVARSSAMAAPVAFSFPAPWSYSGPTPAALPVFNFSYSGLSGTTGVYDSVLTSWNLAGTNQILMTATANYQKGSASLAIPDLSALGGFASAPPSGTEVLWVGLIAQNSQGIEIPLSAGSLITTVANSGTYQVP
jgi:hypothetical protein